MATASIALKVSSTEGDFILFFDTPEAARAAAAEEVKWESTKRVQCAELDIDLKGDFASFIA